jgi:cell division protein FtsL
MSATTLRTQRELVRLQKQIAKGKTVLRELRQTLEDLEDRIELARAKQRNGNKPGIPWAQAKQELGLDDL